MKRVERVRGLGAGMMMMAIAVAVAACEHEAERQSAAAPRPAYFESTAMRPSGAFERVRATAADAPPAPLDRANPAVASDAPPRAGRTDRFLWDDRANIDLPDAGPGVDAGSGPDDGGVAPDSGPDVDAGPPR